MKYAVDYYNKDTNKYYKLLSYNVCWQCMETDKKKISGSAKEYGLKCNSKSINFCRVNVIEICSREDFSFICLQEANKQLAEEIIIELEKKHKMKYGLIHAMSDSKNHGIIIYNVVLFSKIGSHYCKNVTLQNNKIESGRPFICQKFENNITKDKLIVFSIHGSHKPWSLQQNISLMMNVINTSPFYGSIIIMGDFNKEINNNIKINVGNVREFNVLNKHYKTCCILNKNKYSKAYDNILISDDLYSIYGYPEVIYTSNGLGLLPRNFTFGQDFQYKNNTSDHSPIAAIISKKGYSSKVEKISFDFDGVLHTSVKYPPDPDGQIHPISSLRHKPYDMKPNKVIIDEIKRLTNLGHEIYIISHRGKKSQQTINTFLNYHKIPIDKRNIFTISGNKGDLLNKMNIMTHYDDSINVLIDIRMKYKKITLHHVNPYTQKIVKI